MNNIVIEKDWCLKMAQMESGEEIGSRLPMIQLIPIYLAQDMAAAMRDMLDDLDPDADDPSCIPYREVLDEYERIVSGEQLPLLAGINEEETE